VSSWHPTSSQWQFYIAGKGRMTVFYAVDNARTADFNANDVGCVPSNAPHYIENTGDTDPILLETLAAAEFSDVSLNQWLRRVPSEMLKAHPEFLCFVLLKGLGQATREDVEWRSGRLRKNALIQARIFRQHLGWCVRDPLRKKHRAVFGKVSLVKDQKKLRSIRAKPLNGMREAGPAVVEVGNATTGHDAAGGRRAA
jgi:hypothetical protein